MEKEWGDSRARGQSLDVQSKNFKGEGPLSKIQQSLLVQLDLDVDIGWAGRGGAVPETVDRTT